MKFSGRKKDISHWPSEVRRWLGEDPNEVDRPAAVLDVSRCWELLRDSIDIARSNGSAWADIAGAVGVHERTLRRVFRA